MTIQYMTKSYKDQIAQPEFHGRDVTPRSKTAEPIKNMSDITRVEEYILFDKPYRNEEMRYRDHLLFVMGVNFGLRAGDLLNLKIGNILDPETGMIRDKIYIIEEKTEDTRKEKIRRVVYPNRAVHEALDMYFSYKRTLDMDFPLFGSLSRNNTQKFHDTIASRPIHPNGHHKRKTGTDAGMDVRSVNRIIHRIIEDEVGLPVHASSHLLRKTFAYQMLMSFPDRSRALELTQYTLQHSTPQITLHYVGLTEDEIKDAYHRINLGMPRSDRIRANDIVWSSGMGVYA